MDSPTCLPTVRQMSLSQILELQEQPVSEEQAWALCYQLCTLLSVDKRVGRGEYYTSRKTLQFPGADSILLMNDGSVCLTGDDMGMDFPFETEDKMVDNLGRLIYSCLDWGLDSNVERELNETLEALVCQMTKVNLGMNDSFQHVRTFSEVIQICENRLYDPAQAARHYRAVCSTLFSETVELCRYFHNVQHNKKALQKLIIEPDRRIVAQEATNWAFSWKRLMEELNRGVKLRPRGERLNVSAPLPMDYSPFKQLLEDIQLRRYNLRKVQTVGERQKLTGPHAALLEYICSRPKLKPVSERKLKTRPREEASLHEQLMDEIRTVDQMTLLSSRKRKVAHKDNVSSPGNSLMPLCEDSSTEDTSFLLNPIPTPDLQEVETEVDSEEEPCEQGVFQQAINTAVDRELRFLPALSSSPMDPPCGCPRRKQRSRSLGNSLALSRRRHQTEMRALKTCDRYRNWRICSCCAKRSLYFTWHNSCSLCNRVMCPECCIEMRLPFKWCVNLPMSFFKKIVLNKDCEQDVSDFWRQRWAWDSTRVPLVLDCRTSGSFPLHSLAMRDWHSQDICTGCKGFLLDACDSVFSLCPISVPKEI
ncbi:protein spire homolog 1 [Megalops cyprinoides]|uniref:protein spire homolog 1 n=1 Tax=Megalops cyprinoides TaxID=118141 RepID=UPI00186529D8|nr:protein spire homolog 1 [Megalops cyprinoides]